MERIFHACFLLRAVRGKTFPFTQSKDILRRRENMKILGSPLEGGILCNNVYFDLDKKCHTPRAAEKFRIWNWKQDFFAYGRKRELCSWKALCTGTACCPSYAKQGDGVFT